MSAEFIKSIGYKVPAKSAEVDDDDEETRETERSEEQARIDNADPLTEDETAEKEELLNKGFDNWSKKDFNNFVNACAKHGRNQLASIADEVEGKTLDEVKKYSKVFWARYKELSDYEKLISKIEKGESELLKQVEIQEQLSAKVTRHRMPLQQMKIQYSQPTKGKNYTEEEDRFLIVMLEKHGYGTENVYDRIRQEIRNSPLFRFDWFLKSRTAQEIGRRCNTLISLIQKEDAEVEEKEKEDKKKKIEEKKKATTKASVPKLKKR
ncbi:SWI/SNF-related matrix-associated actin-dependent regulator of chromatin subfamily A member 5, partial [Jimgerdemannia flammicorona]